MKIYVNANAAKNGNGTAEMPFRCINDAARIAQPGDEVLVAPGIYREYVDPVHAGTEDQRITYRSGVRDRQTREQTCGYQGTQSGAGEGQTGSLRLAAANY